ncbi:MAG: LuxR C-terminal-related transcriptional regulator [Tatlockia sp.]|jgi:DNA-binding CsgD family transcriptional regulator
MNGNKSSKTDVDSMISKQLITQISHIFQHSLDAVYVKDENLRYHYLNPVGLNQLKLSEQDYLFLTDKEMYLSLFADDYISHDLAAINGTIYHQIDCIMSTKGEHFFAVSHKLPLKDALNKTLGVLCFSQFINQMQLTTLLSENSPFQTRQFKLSENTKQLLQEPTELTKRELDVLFCLLRGKTNKTIADCLNITERTVVFHLNAIKRKWDCHSKEAVFEAAINKGFLEFTRFTN